MKPAAKRNVVWSGIEAAVAGSLSFASAFVVARLVGPSEFGIGTAAVALHVILWVGVNALFADALVQRAALDDLVTASAFWASVAVGIACAAIQAGAGPWLASSLADARLVPMCLLLALPLPLVGAGGVGQGLLTRRRAYRALAGRAIVGQGLGTLAGIGAAFDHAGAWAPVVQQCVTSTAGAATLLARMGWRPALCCHWPSIRALLRVALPLTASTLVLTARYRLFALILGSTAGPTALGETHMAFRLVDTVRELCSTALWRLMLPVLAGLQHDEAALRTAVDRLVRQSTSATLPLCGAMALCLPPLVRHVLGPSWIAAGQATEPLIALMAMLCVMFPAGVAVVARGQTARALVGNVACLLLTLAGVLLARPETASQAVLIWCGAQVLAAPYVLWVNGRAIGTGPLRPLRGGIAMVLVTLLALAAAVVVPVDVGWGARSLLRLVLRVAVFALVSLAAGSLLQRIPAHVIARSKATKQSPA
ncbi:MAG TPA: oligosaccharide flippase family protein [Acetobacteraceae bacterium]|nr:oligosaccharide flippase family protein [Acetobacteraceae bacterium]